MTSLEFESSPDDPSPRLAELADAALRLPYTNELIKETEPEVAQLTMHSYDGIVTLQKALPELPLDVLYELRDAITQQCSESAKLSNEIELQVHPETVFARWMKKFYYKPIHDSALITPPEPAARIEIIEPVEGKSEQLHVKTYPECHAVVIRKTSFIGRFTINDTLYELSPENVIFEVGSSAYNPNPSKYSEYFDTESRRHYTFIPSRGSLYRSNQYGGTLNDTEIMKTAKKKKAYGAIEAILDEVHSTPRLSSWYTNINGTPNSR